MLLALGMGINLKEMEDLYASLRKGKDWMDFTLASGDSAPDPPRVVFAARVYLIRRLLRTQEIVHVQKTTEVNHECCKKLPNR